MRSLTFVDLFAGCGGLALGFKHEGFEPAAAVEIDREAAHTYASNIDPQIYVEDIASVNDRRAWPKVDVVIGGPPCQGFSQLGTRDPDDPRNRLWREYLRALDLTEAKVFVMENVPQLLRSEQFDLFRRQVERRGFSVVAGVLSAADYGVPQLRRRAIAIGSLLGKPSLPGPSHGQNDPAKLPLETVRRALAGLPLAPDGKNWHVSRPGIRPTSIIRYIAVPPDGGNRFQMQTALEQQGRGDLVPDCWRNKVTGTTDVFGRLWWDKPSATIRTEFFKPEKGRYLHPTEHRPITVREAARLQSFPDDFIFSSNQSMISVARQIGNAVPPILAAAIARAVRTQMAQLGRGSSKPERRQTAMVAVGSPNVK